MRYHSVESRDFLTSGIISWRVFLWLRTLQYSSQTRPLSTKAILDRIYCLWNSSSEVRQISKRLCTEFFEDVLFSRTALAVPARE
jgi:hypothetical protein